MACVHKVQSETPLPGGEKLIRGSFKFDSSYPAGGEVLNLANYLSSGDSPAVVCSCADGYLVEHSQGTASAGKVLAYFNVMNTNLTNGVAANTALYQVQTAKDLSAVNVVFFAVGKAY